MKKNLICCLLVAVFSQLVFAHGEDRKGPHGGYVRMPGAFHTELVQDGKNKIKVYLLDIDWKNPSIKESSVKAFLKVKKNKNLESKCEVVQDYFSCAFAESVDLNKKGELKVMPIREGQKGNAAVYRLPFALEAAHDM